MRGALVRSLAVLLLGLAALGVILYYASTVDGRAPWVERIALTQHLSGDERAALTTTSIEVTFSEAVQASTAETAFRVEPAVDGSFSWNGPVLTFTPAERLPLETEFVVQLAAGVRDRAGNAMGDPSSALSFRTVGNPRVVGSSPEPRADEVEWNEPVILRFSTLMDTASVEAALSISPAAEVVASWSGEELTLAPVTRWAAGQRYAITISTDALDAAGTPLRRPFRLSFRTVRSALAADTLFPADGSEGIAPSTPIAIIFDRPLDPDSFDADAFSIQPEVAGGLELGELPGAAGLEHPGPRVVRFQPSAPLAASTTYTITFRGGLGATDGSQLAGDLAWRFTTGVPQEALSNQVTFLSARAGVVNLWAMNPDGTGERQLSAELSPVIDYAVAPDGRSFVVSDGAALVEQQADGRSRRLLTRDGALEFDPAFAPDGSRLVFGRADARTGAGLGLWLLERGASEASRLQLPAADGNGSASASPSGSGSQQPADPVLRAPRFAPDGSAIAFVDLSGRVAVLDLERDALASAAWIAVGPPVWLPDSSGVLVGGLGAAGRALPAAGAGQPQPAFDPGSLALSVTRRAAMAIGRFARDGERVVPGPEPGGASRPVVAADGRYAYIVAEPSSALAAGEAWFADDPRARPGPVASAERATLAATFGVAPGSLLVTRLPTEDGPIERAAIWLVGIDDGDEQELTRGGWLPRWLP